MIQTLLSFILGFLVAGLIALLAAPVLWRRAGQLARKRMEATMPLSRAELEAEFDVLRAENAMTVRKLEMKAEALHKRTVEDLVVLNTQREHIAALTGELDVHRARIEEMESEHKELTTRLSMRESDVKSLTARLEKAEAQLKEQLSQVEELSRLYEEASLTASSRQIEIVSRESDIEQLKDTIGQLRNQRREAIDETRQAVAERKEVEEALKVAQQRAAVLDRKLERMITTLSTRDEALERREREIERLKTKIRETAQADAGASSRLEDAERQRERLETQVADLSLQLSSLLASGGEGEGDAVRQRMQSRLATLMRENRKLRERLSASADAGEGPAPGDAALREQIASLAAEVVNMAAQLEGPGSPIEKVLGSAEDHPAGAAGQHPPSLAERVRALREGAPAQ